MPKLSVVSAFYNRASMVAESVGSLLNQTCDDYEVIIINDGSTDNTVEALDALNDARLRVIHQTNTGFTKAIIRAVEEAQGDYIAVHGSGDISLPERLAKQAAILDAHPDVAVVGCHLQENKPTGTNIFKQPNDLPFFDTLLQRNLFSHGEVMFRKSVYEQAGGYREFFMFAQDRDLWLRMARYGDYHTVQEVLYVRESPEEAVSRNPQKQLMQAYLASFAVECAREHNAKGKDLLERFGPQGVFLRTGSQEMARRLVNLAAGHYRRGDDTQARELVMRALKECICNKTLLAYAASCADRTSFTRKLITLPVFKRWG